MLASNIPPLPPGSLAAVNFVCRVCDKAGRPAPTLARLRADGEVFWRGSRQSREVAIRVLGEHMYDHPHPSVVEVTREEALARARVVGAHRSVFVTHSYLVADLRKSAPGRRVRADRLARDLRCPDQRCHHHVQASPRMLRQLLAEHPGAVEVLL